MVSLPELDSEIGVLRFLKWKTRLLCLDVIRASGKAYVSNLDDVAEPASLDPEISSNLEQQDDAAVLRLALSKLNPRHREVLLASIYEEKSAAQIAAQVGLSENATRQLIFRARSAFKKALLGDDVNTDGMTAAAILSVAARKAAHEAKKVGAQAMVFVLFLMLAVGAVVNFTGRGTQTQQLAESQAPAPAPAQTQAPEAVAPITQETTEPVQTPEIPATFVSNAQPSAQPSPSTSPFSQAELNQIFSTTPDQVNVFRLASIIDTRQAYRVVSSQGLVAEFTFDANSDKPFGDVLFTIDVKGKQYQAYPDKSEFFQVTDKQGLDRFIYYGSLAYVFDEDGKVWSESELAKGTARLELVIDVDRKSLKQSVLTVLPKE
jgi:RNA polymerase sigma-70 factor (ECF subfamily)